MLGFVDGSPAQLGSLVPGGAVPYRPTMAEAEAEVIRGWHERAYLAARAEGARDQVFDYLGLSVTVPPGVMPVTGMSHLLGEAVLAEARPADRVLDMGTGSGVNALLAASRGAQVVAADINPLALDAAAANAERNGLAHLVDIRHSDVFSDITETFDLIIFDPPFRWFPARDMFEAATTDENYRALTAFFRQARWHLSPAGRMLIFFGTSGDLGYLRQLIAAGGFQAEVIAHDELARDGRQVGYFTFKVS
jgi:release factor glutamine methyltransferase